MNNPTVTEWNLPLSRSDFDKLVKGFNSEFRRSWVGDLYFILEVAADHPSGHDPAIKTIIWESLAEEDYQLTVATAKDAVVHISRAYMECEIEAYPKIDWKTTWEVAPLLEKAGSEVETD
ncbi:uncharacterized protein K489DRAFT_407561 [Dissoconium aciculare CBS 342.82]|uniref:Uncharacterized protein n=1 Tax=Dissoconium aciculare CBS 342.82 TaxID=1314786 RepID=A0A6J3MB02_9PEZI|nr:uncharacterized protein K489DRAFT_407561 [Dissoconium aciculare CBS 342.82]KAF1824814.1 hypothetical protein K489DRAFT_407561 [Dissoconium aciculare CBS 342.82]